MLHVKRGLVTWALSSSAAVLGLSAAAYPLLHTEAPAVQAAAFISGDAVSRSLSAQDVASMKSQAMDYDVRQATLAAAAARIRAVTAAKAAVAARQQAATPASQPTVQQPATPQPAGVFTSAMVEALWIREGGNPATAAADACIVSHESGGRANAISPTDDFGLDQIHGDPAALNPVVSTQVAIRMSFNGTNWSAWSTHASCGV